MIPKSGPKVPKAGMYQHLSEDEWLPVPRGATLTLACCDCSLTHVIEIRDVGKVRQFRFKRHERATAALRRKKGGT